MHREPMRARANWRLYAPLDSPLVVHAHIHVPYVSRKRGLTVANACSVGLPYDGDRRASHLLIDDSELDVCRTEYDIDGEIAGLRSSGLPHAEWVGRMLTAARPFMP